MNDHKDHNKNPIPSHLLSLTYSGSLYSSYTSSLKSMNLSLKLKTLTLFHKLRKNPNLALQA